MSLLCTNGETISHVYNIASKPRLASRTSNGLEHPPVKQRSWVHIQTWQICSSVHQPFSASSVSLKTYEPPSLCYTVRLKIDPGLQKANY